MHMHPWADKQHKNDRKSFNISHTFLYVQAVIAELFSLFCLFVLSFLVQAGQLAAAAKVFLIICERQHTSVSSLHSLQEFLYALPSKLIEDLFHIRRETFLCNVQNVASWFVHSTPNIARLSLLWWYSLDFLSRLRLACIEDAQRQKANV